MIFHVEEAAKRGDEVSLVAIVTKESNEVWRPDGPGRLRTELDACGCGSMPVTTCLVDPNDGESLVRNVFAALSAPLPYGTGKAPCRTVVDITHGFRSIGLLTVAAIEAYADLALDVGKEPAIEIRYGALDARSKEGEHTIVPIWDLTPIVLQHQWTAAIRALRSHSRADAFAALCRDLATTLHHRGKATARDAVRQLGNTAKTFADSITTCRLPALLTSTARELVSRIDSALPHLCSYTTATEKPLKELRRHAEQLNADDPISERGVLAGLAFARLAFETERFAECAAILREVTITAFSVSRAPNSKLPQPGGRDQGFREWRKTEDEALQKHADACKGTVGADDASRAGQLAKFYLGLTGTRNDIEHAGMNEQSRDANSLRRSLEDNLEAAKKLLPSP